MTSVLLIVSTISFTATLFVRALDPLVPLVAADFAISPATVALVTTAFALPFALVQPVLGPVGDMFGKTRLITISILVLAASAALCAVATSFSVLTGARIVAGIAAGGILPVAIAIVADHVPVATRQIALGRLMGAAITGQLTGAAMAGVLGDLVGWRSVFVVLGVCGTLGFAFALYGFRFIAVKPATGFGLKVAIDNYRAIIANPRAKICFGGVFLEALAIIGTFPFVALLLAARGETRASIAGLVIGGFAIGGVIYTLTVHLLLRLLSQTGLMRLGGLTAAVGLIAAAVGTAWPVELAAYVAVGIGFYFIHGGIQAQATELSQTARGAAVALHSFFFFMGQAAGPVLYGAGIDRLGATATFLLGAALIIVVGFGCAYLFRDRAPAA